MNIRPELLEQIEVAAIRCRQLISQGDGEQALKEARDLLSLDPEDVNVCQTVAMLLTDGGAAVSDIGAIDQGLDLFSRLVSVLERAIPEEDNIVYLKYSLSNAHSSRYAFFRDSDPVLAANDLQNQKDLLQELLLVRPNLPLDLEPMVLTNYANLLDHSNRTFEAIDAYLDCLDIEPNHGLARGNCGVALIRLPVFSRQHQLENCQASWDLLSGAVSSPDSVTQWADGGALTHLLKKKDEFLSDLTQRFDKGIETVEEFRRHRLEEHAEPRPPEWLEAIVDARLLLSFNQLPLNSVDEVVDDAYFDGIARGLSKEEETKSVELVNLFNNLKEEYVSARHMFFQVRNEPERLAAYNRSTYYGEPEGDAEFGLVSGLLKASFRSSIELLDKIALFLAVYFELGVPKRSPNFNNVWFQSFDPKKEIPHPSLVEPLKFNFPLMGLRDIQKDLFRQRYPGRVRDARHATVHRWLKMSHLPVETDGAVWNLEDFSSITFFMLRQAKSAILLLAATVNMEEQRRAAAQVDDGRVMVPSLLMLRQPISSRTESELESDLLEDLDTQCVGSAGNRLLAV